MKTDWLEQDRQIGEWLDKHGVENYEQCPIIRRTMLYGGSARRNQHWQKRHHTMLERLAPTYGSVVEIGAGTGQFASMYNEFSKYKIYDLPQIRRVQKHIIGSRVEWIDKPEMNYGLIVSLFALSEIPIDDRQQLLSEFGLDNAMFFAFQKDHEDMNNWEWFMDFGWYLGRGFVIKPCKVSNCFYMYVEAE